MMSPLKFVIILFLSFWGLLLILSIGSAIIYSYNSSENTGSEGNGYIAIDVAEYDDSEIKDTIYENFSPDEDIAGYDRTTESDGDVEFVIYRAKEKRSGDGTFPTVMVYARYNGEKEYDYTGYDVEAEHSGYVTIVNSSCESIGGIWFAADTQYTDCEMTIKYYLFSEDSQTEALTDLDGDYAGHADITGILKLDNIG